jgi:hypothetical protein
MRLLRFRIRTLMVAVAIMGVALAVAPRVFTFALCWRRSYRLAEIYRDSAMELRKSAIVWTEIEGCIPVRGVRITVFRRDQMLRTAAHYDRLALKYDRAAHYPWLPVPPDPPEPE